MFSLILFSCLALFALVVLYVLGTFLILCLRQYVSPLHSLPGPPSQSFFIGNLKEMHDQENNNLVARWTAAYGHTFVYRGFVNGYRLMTTDPLAVSHILGHAYDFPKPDFIRDALAEMAAGHDGLLTVEGDRHSRQRKILAPAFSASHIRTLSPLFYDKASQLRDIWLDIIRYHNPKSNQLLSPALPSSPSDPLVQPVIDLHDDLQSNRPTSTLGNGRPLLHLPNPFAGFEPSKSLHTASSSTGSSHCAPDGAGLRTRKARSNSRLATKYAESVASASPTSPGQYLTVTLSPSDSETPSPTEHRGPKVDVLAWMARATLDTIGEAGFGYHFNSLSTAAKALKRSRQDQSIPPSPSLAHTSDGSTEPSNTSSSSDEKHAALNGEEEEEENELAKAFGIIFSTARQFRVFTILQVWFPFLRRFKRDNATMQHARATMHRIGMELITQKREEILKAGSKASHNSSAINANGNGDDEDLDEKTKGRDLLSVLIRSNSSPTLPPTHRLTLPETLSQISTFLSAGHETTSSALTWTLYVLAKDSNGHSIQRRLRQELREIHRLHSPAVPSGSSTEEELGAVLKNPYLDAVVRESLRVNSPVTTTMRVALKDSVIPVSSPPGSPSSPPYPSDTLSNGTTSFIRVNKGDIISIPIQAINKNKDVYGEDADEFRPERWLSSDGFIDQICSPSPTGKKGIQGLWGGILTFLNGNPINGNRACIGYRFSINEIKIFLYVLMRDIEFTLDDDIEIEKKVNVVTRPCVKSEPHLGNQMPLRMRYVPPNDP